MSLRDHGGHRRGPGANHALTCPIEWILGLGLVVVGLQVLFGVDMGDTAASSIVEIAVLGVLLLWVVIVVIVLLEDWESKGRCCGGCASTGGRGSRRGDALANFVA